MHGSYNSPRNPALALAEWWISPVRWYLHLSALAFLVPRFRRGSTPGIGKVKG